MSDPKEAPQKKVKALLLVGGFGTRLRPLTFSKPKPLIEFINKPVLVHQIEALKSVGVEEIVLAVNYSSEKMFAALKEYENTYNIKITCSKEEYPLGTAGPIGLAKSYLEDADIIFVFNADVTCKFPLKEMLDFHLKHGKEGTIATKTVSDPSRFGVIVTDENDKILQFVEKPQEYVGNRINAGLYIFNKMFLNRVEAKPTSIEREVFPKMAADQQLYAFPLEGFWADIGKPAEYLVGTRLFLDNLSKYDSSKLEKLSEKIVDNVIVGENAVIEDGCILGPNVVVGKGVVVKKGCRIKNSVLLDKCVIGEYAFVEGSIIGWKSVIGKWCRVENLCVIGEEVNVKDEVCLKNNSICPFISIKSSPKEGSVILC